MHVKNVIIFISPKVKEQLSLKSKPKTFTNLPFSKYNILGLFSNFVYS